MKIALINDKYIHHEGGGAQESVRILAETLVRHGHQVSVWATTYEEKQQRTTEMHAGVRVTFLPVKNVYWPHQKRPGPLKPLWHAIDSHNPLMARQVATLLDEEQPDLLHTNILAGFSPAVWAEAARRGVPVVHTLRDYYLNCPRGSMFKSGTDCPTSCTTCRIYSAPKHAALRHVDALVGISRHLLAAHHYSEDLGPAPVREVIHNSYAAAGELAPKAPSSRLRVGYLGRLCHTKGIELLLDAAAQVGSCDLFIAGKGDPGYEASLRARAGGNVTFLGVVPPRELFEKIDVLVAPSLWHEPFGRVAIEALAWGVPVIASRRGGLPEIVHDDGATGFLFEPDEKGSLVKILRSLTGKACADRRDACLQRARDFLPEEMARRYEQLYIRLLDKKIPAAHARAEMPRRRVAPRYELELAELNFTHEIWVNPLR
jgi:glycosyltransferase involved in cell wall biosynthesis